MDTLATEPNNQRPEKSATRQIFTKDFLACSATNFLLYVNYYTLMVIMAGFCIATYQTDVATAGFAASIFIVGALVSRFLGGGIIDYFGRKRCLAVGAFFMMLFSVTYLIAVPMPVLFGFRVLHGFAYGLAQTAVTSLATETTPADHKGEGVGYFMLSVTIGSAVGPFLGTTIIQYANFALLFGICAVVGALSFIGSLIVHDSHAPLRKAKRAPKNVARKEGHNAAAVKPTAPELATPEKPSFSLSSFIEISVLPISAIIALAYLAYGAVMTYLNSFAAQENLVTAASFFFVVYSAVMFIARPITGRMFDQKGDFRVMLIGFGAYAIGMAVMGLAHNGFMLLLAAGLLGLGIGAMQPGGLTLAVQKASDKHLTRANSTYFCVIDASIGVAPLVLGWTIPLIGYSALFVILAGVVALALVLYLICRKKGVLY